jgi:hypothetical protein
MADSTPSHSAAGARPKWRNIGRWILLADGGFPISAYCLRQRRNCLMLFQFANVCFRNFGFPSNPARKRRFKMKLNEGE